MKLVFLYGPPAAGKLTIAKELEKLTGFKIFHNHLTNDMVESIFQRGSDHFRDLISKFRLDLIEAAAKHGVNIIFTMVYAKSEHDDNLISDVVRCVEKHGGTVNFVQLQCEVSEIRKRLKHPSRAQYKKLKKVTVLNELLKTKDLLSSVPHANNLTIDTTKTSPKKNAAVIARHFKL